MGAYLQLQVLALAASSALVAAQSDNTELPNPVINLSSCQSLSCTPADGSICSAGDSPGPKAGVGIAAQAFNISSASFSFTLTDGLDENGFTGIGTEQYEYSDQQLFVGVDPNLNHDDYPSGCALVMQYLGQTFPEESLPNNENPRPESRDNTTSCDGVVNSICRSAIYDMIRSFNSSGSEWDHDRCASLSQHVNTQLRSQPSTCGGEGTWISNFINVTAGALPRPNSAAANSERLGGNDCRPVLPQTYELHKVAEVRQIYFSDPPEEGSEFYGRIFGGRAGFTPLATVVYGSQSDPDVQFTCMQTFEADGSARENQLGGQESAGRKTACVSAIAVLLCVALFL